MKTCFLIGHRDAPFIIRGKLEKAIAKAIADCGVTEFVVGQYGAFDKMVAACLAEAKKDHPELRLVLLLPYHPSERAVVLPAGFDASFYPPGMETVPRRLAIVRANEYMAKHCDLLIAYAVLQNSNPADERCSSLHPLIAYAVLQNSNPGRIMRKVRPGCAVINLADDEGRPNHVCLPIPANNASVRTFHVFQMRLAVTGKPGLCPDICPFAVTGK